MVLFSFFKKELLTPHHSACPHVAGVVATILSNPQTDDKSPFNVLSQLLILADKNAITNPVGETVNAEAHIST